MIRGESKRGNMRGRVGLEQRLAAAIPVRHVVLTGYARNALYLLVKAMEWDKGSEIIIPAFTCSVVPMTIRQAGAVPVPVDAEARGVNMDPGLIEKAITPRTRAIYVVHTYGMPASMDEICAIAKRHGLKVIEDLAQSLFAVYRSRNTGSFGDFAILSFTKKIINYEGGAVTTNDEGICNRLRETQAALAVERIFSISGLTDQIVRVISSMWESRFGFPVLMVFKLLDLINTLLYRGAYGVSINPRRFTMQGLAVWLTRLQLDAWMNKTGREKSLRRFETGLGGIILNGSGRRSGGERRAEYFTGIPVRDSAWLRLVSFRTWHNFNERGVFPRADYLYDKYRVFSRIVPRFARSGKGEAITYQEQEYDRSAGSFR